MNDAGQQCRALPTHLCKTPIRDTTTSAMQRIAMYEDPHTTLKELSARIVAIRDSL